MGNLFLALFVFAVAAAVAFTDWFFPARRDCACGGEMFRTTVLSTDCQTVRHVPYWFCRRCGTVIEMHSHGAVQQLTNWWKKGRSSRKPATP